MQQRRYKNQPLLQWQIDYIIAHADEPRRKVAADIEVTDATVRKYVRQHHPEKIRHDFPTRGEVIRLYPTMTCKEIAARLGRSVSWVCTIATEEGLRHDETTMQRIRASWKKNLEKCYAPETVVRRAATQRRKNKMERLRILSGEPQKSRRHFSQYPRNVMWTRCALIRKGRCMCDPEGDFLTLLITPGCKPFPTRRNASEQYYAQKYGFKFVRPAQPTSIESVGKIESIGNHPSIESIE